MKRLICSCFFFVQVVFAQGISTPVEQAKALPIADVHMHVTKLYGNGFAPSDALKGMNESNVKWGGAVGFYSPEAQQNLGNRYIPAFGQREFFKVLYDKGESGLLDPNNFTQMFAEAEELFKAGKIKGFGEIHTSNNNSSDFARNKRDIRAKSPVVEKMFEMANRYKGFVAIHNEHSQQATQDVLELSGAYPQTALILDHCVFGASTDEIRSILKATENVFCEISSNGATQSTPKAAGMMRIHGGFGGIKDDWLKLILEFPDRFMLGSDACCGLTSKYSQIIDGLRNDVLAKLPPDVMEKVAYRNAVRVFNLTE